MMVNSKIFLTLLAAALLAVASAVSSLIVNSLFLLLMYLHRLPSRFATMQNSNLLAIRVQPLSLAHAIIWREMWRNSTTPSLLWDQTKAFPAISLCELKYDKTFSF